MGEWRYNPPFLTSAADGVEWSYPGGRALHAYSIGGWVCPRADFDAVEKKKILPLAELESFPSSK
jgi:hypothetical protein